MNNPADNDLLELEGLCLEMADGADEDVMVAVQKILPKIIKLYKKIKNDGN